MAHCSKGIPWAKLIVLTTSLAGLCVNSAKAGEPFGPEDFDVVYSDAASVRYRVDRNDCPPGVLGCSNLLATCGPTIDPKAEPCYVGVHRFCGARGYVSGYGVEDGSESSVIDIVCLTSAGAKRTGLVSHIDLGSHHPLCITEDPVTKGPIPIISSRPCTVSINRYCQAWNDADGPYQGGFGPVERNATVGMVTCVKTVASKTFQTAVGVIEVDDCAYSIDEISNDCRRSMDQFCQDQPGDLSGGIGPRERYQGILHFDCVNKSPWVANASLPEVPSLPIDIIPQKIDSTTTVRGDAVTPCAPGSYHQVPERNVLEATRSLSFDGRVYARATNVGNLEFRLQTPEIFTEPVSQVQTPTCPVPQPHQTSSELGFWANFYGESVAPDLLFGPLTGNAEFDLGSIAICDPHQGSQALEHANRQQSVPSRVSNPSACDSLGGTAGVLDHDCYDLTVVVVVSDDENDDELRSARVTVVVEKPKMAGVCNRQVSNSRARVVDVIVHQSGTTRIRDPDDPTIMLEPTLTGDGRVLLVQGNKKIMYSLIEDPDAPCDVTAWGSFRNLSEMHGDSRMSDYGLAKFPIRDLEGKVVPPGDPIEAAYLWVDRDGDNMMFMYGAATFYYEDADGNVQERHQVLGHPTCGTDPLIEAGVGSVPLDPSTVEEMAAMVDTRKREGLTFVGLWTHGKMFTPDSRNNAADFAIPALGAPQAFHREVGLYVDAAQQTVSTEVGTSVRTAINSIENQFFLYPNLQPDTPREVVWMLSTQNQTDEVAFDDAMDPRALIVSPMNTSILPGAVTNRFQDGFVNTGLSQGEGFQFPAHLANAATTVSEDVAVAEPSLTTMVQWNLPPFGYLLGGARAEPIAAGGFKGKGLWLDGIDDRLEYVVPEQPPATQIEMTDGPWFFNLSFDPRDLSASRRLLTLADGTWLDIDSSTQLTFGNTTSHSITIPPALALAANVWSTLGVLSKPNAVQGVDLELYLDGYLLLEIEAAESSFRVSPGRMSVSASSGGFKGWIDDFKVLGREPSPEVICNHARGTLIGVAQGDQLEARALAYPPTSHTRIDELSPTPYALFACERPIAQPVDADDWVSHAHYTCLGQTRRLETNPNADKCIKHALLFPDFPLDPDEPRPSAVSNSFCLSCHVEAHPSVTMQPSTALIFDPMVLMRDDIRRQPMQEPPKVFGVIPP